MATMARAATALRRPGLRGMGFRRLPACCWHCCRSASTSTNANAQPRRGAAPHLSKPRDIAIVGGGLTGLCTAYYLAALLPLTCKITVYEGNTKTGGWVDSHQIRKKNSNKEAELSDEEIELRGKQMMLEEELQEWDQNRKRAAMLRAAGSHNRSPTTPDDEAQREFERDEADDEASEMEAVRQILADRRAVQTAPVEILEGGPRMVAPQSRSTRFDDLLFLELVDDLELLDALRVSDQAHAQYIYYPDRLVNMKMTATMPQLRDFFDDGEASGSPVSIFNYANAMIKWVSHCLRELVCQPLFRRLAATVPRMLATSLLPSAEQKHARAVDTAATMTSPGRLPPDTSVGAYFARLTGGRAVSDHLLGALMHGIYGGDVWRLSIASSPFRGLWLARGTGAAFRAWSQRATMDAMREAHGLPGSSHENNEKKEAFYNDAYAANGLEMTPPLTPETQILARRYTDERPASVAMESDMAMLRDLLARQLEVYAEHRGFPTTSGGNPAVRFGRLAEASMRWTTMTFANEHGGFGAMTRALTELLRAKTNVVLKTNTRVTGIAFDAPSQCVKVTSQPTLTGPPSVPRAENSNGPGKGSRTVKFPSAPPPPRATHALYDRVISAVTAPQLARLTHGVLPSLRHEHAVTIQVVNLYYEDHAELHWPHKGFGYLIPSTVPLEQNPEAALGVIFDSDREQALRPLREEEYNGNDAPEAFEEWERYKVREERRLAMRRQREAARAEKEAAKEAARETEKLREKRPAESALDAELEKAARHFGFKDVDDFARKNLDLDEWHGRGRGDRGDRAMLPNRRAKRPGTKFTVMFGGHYWDGYGPNDYPSDKEAVARAEAVLHRHLSSTDAHRPAGTPPSVLGSSNWTTRPRPTATRVKLCHECIPQHDVGHAKRMAEVDRELRKEFGGGRLAVVGGSFTATGPGVLPSIRSAWDMALRVAGRGYLVQADRNNMYLGGDIYASTANRHNGSAGGEGGERDGMTTMAHVGDTGLGRFADPSVDPAIPVIKKSLPFRYGNPTTLREYGAWTVTMEGEDKVVMGEGAEEHDDDGTEDR